MRNNTNTYNYLGLTFKQQKEYKQSIRERDNYTCQLCGNPGYDVDHIIPFHISHDSSPDNLRILCHKCNLLTREKVLPEGYTKSIPINDYETYLRDELAKYQNRYWTTSQPHTP